MTTNREPSIISIAYTVAEATQSVHISLAFEGAPAPPARRGHPPLDRGS